MIKLSLICALFLMMSGMAHSSEPEPDIELHCSGRSWRVIGSAEEVPTDALVRIDEHGTYIAITAVGTGQSNKRPRKATNIESVGAIVLQGAAAGDPPIEAWFNINRYSGELVVAPVISGGKILFLGSCRKSDPLF